MEHARWLDVDRFEHPQNSGIVVAYLDPELAAEVDQLF